MPLFMDRHELSGVTAVDAAGAHLQDLAVQDRFGVRYLTYWFDYERQRAYCLARGPDREAVQAVHAASHGMLAHQITEVDPQDVERFLGPLTERPHGEPFVASAFRTILFTDIHDSTRLTQRLGDVAAMRMLRQHDRIVRAAIETSGGREIKHTGDGLMAAFAAISPALDCAVAIQRGIAEESDAAGAAPLSVGIGLAAGEPVLEQGDLFGAAVQLAARLCDRASPGTILASSAVRDLSIGKSHRFSAPRRVRLKGFDEPVSMCEVLWERPTPTSS